MTDRNQITFQNGTLDVDEYVQGNIKLHNSPLHSVNVLPYKFNEDVESQLWLNSINDIFNGNEQQLRLLQQWFGYNCVPDMCYEKFMLCIGKSRSGRSTISNVLAAILGPKQCASVSLQTLKGLFGYQSFIDKLAVFINKSSRVGKAEVEDGLEKIGTIVGGDSVSIDRRCKPVLPSVELTCRFTIIADDLPHIFRADDYWEQRLNILHFPNCYIDKENFLLKRELVEEAKAGKIINWTLRGLRYLRQEGKFIITPQQKQLLDQS